MNFPRASILKPRDGFVHEERNPFLGSGALARGGIAQFHRTVAQRYEPGPAKGGDDSTGFRAAQQFALVFHAGSLPHLVGQGVSMNNCARQFVSLMNAAPPLTNGHWGRR